MKELKKPLTYEEQVKNLIENHHLIIKNKKFAIKVLNEISYYRLSGYGYGLKQKDNPEFFIENTSIKTLYELYRFDSLFKNALINLIEQIEIQLRSQIGNYMSNKYHALCYLDKRYFNDKIKKDGKSVHDRILSDFKKERDRQKNLPFVHHYIKNYDNQFPLWVAIELFTFGNISSFYDIMKDEDKNEIIKLYGCKKSFILRSWLLAIVEVRNICAHYGRLYNMPLKQTPFLYAENKQYRQNTNKIFPVLLVIKRMLHSDYRWNYFLKRLKSLINQYRKSIRLSYIGFPPDWENILSK